MKTAIRWSGAALLLCTTICHAQPVLTGVSLYTADASGRGQGPTHWNTLGTPDQTYNLYLFTGSTASPTFLNSGNTDASLNPNLALTSGSHVIQFAGQNPVSGYMGINFYFNNSTSNAITAFVPWDGSTGFSVVAPDLSTVGQSGNQPSSGQLSFSIADIVVTLTDFHKSDGNTDIIAGYNNVPDSAQDTTGTFTLSVGPTVEGTPPAITTPPQSTNAPLGSTVVLAVVAEGSPPLSYQWSHDNTPIPGANSSSITLANLQSADQGVYSVQVTNRLGTNIASATVSVIVPTEPILTGVSLYSANASGAVVGSTHWNTLGAPDLTYNLYLFTGSTASPTFLNSGNTDASLNPNLALTGGAHVIQFAGQNPVSGYLGINFYFNNSTSNAITAFVPWDGSTGFSVVAPGIQTAGQSGNQPSSGQLSFSIADQVVTLTDFHKTAGNTDIIAGYNNVPDSAQDTTGTFTLSVGPVVEGTPPIAKITISPLLLGPPETNLIVLAPDGHQASVTLDGSLSFDPEGAPLEFFWLDASHVPFATGVRTTNLFSIGSHVVALAVSDGTDVGTNQVTFEIVTSAGGVAAIIDFIEGSDLSRAVQRPLVASLENTLRALQQGKPKTAINQLQAFQNKVQAQLGRTSPITTKTLIDAAQQIIDIL